MQASILAKVNAMASIPLDGAFTRKARFVEDSDLLETLEDGCDVFGYLLEDVVTVELGEEVCSREHLLGGSIRIRCEAEDVDDAAGTVCPGVLPHALLHTT